MEEKIKKIIRKVLNEIDYSNINEVIKLSDFLTCFKKSDLKKVNELLTKIRSLGVVNMFGAGEFLMMTKQYFLDYMRLKSYERDFDEDEIEEISDLIEDVRNIMIAGAIKMVEKDNIDVNVNTVTRAVRLLAQNTIKYYMTGVLNDRQ
jgi:hypothetical protein